MVNDAYEWVMDAYDETTSKVDTIAETREIKDHMGAYDQRTSVIGTGRFDMQDDVDSAVDYVRPSEGYTAYAAWKEFTKGTTLGLREVKLNPKAKDLFKDTVEGWGRGRRSTEDDLASKFFLEGAYTAGSDYFKNSIGSGHAAFNTGGLAYDGYPFFNLSGNNRPSKVGGSTYYNAFASKNLTQTNFGQLYELMMVTNAFDENDEEVDLEAMGDLILLIPPQLRDEAVVALESEKSQDNAYNNKNPWFKAAKIVEWRMLAANSTTWHIGIAKKGIRFYRERTPEILIERDIDTHAYKASIRVLYGMMVWNWRFWAAANVVTS